MFLNLTPIPFNEHPVYELLVRIISIDEEAYARGLFDEVGEC